MSTPQPSQNMLDFFRLIGRLKTTKRTGWVRSNVNLPESISDHMYRMALIAFAIPHKNRDHLIRMALVHDLAECIVGDITPHDNVSKEQKRQMEEDAMRHIRDDILKGSPAGKDMYELWKEYEDGTTEEAKLMKDIDKFEMILQADEYEREQGVQLQEFFDSTKDVFRTKVGTELNKELRQDRNVDAVTPSKLDE
ncbi:Metal-dependent nucleoside 5'-monophosphatase [Gracilaria domingensis]|nr:Metal-dependent nucleoside 5'-monophosphatase [Gracilaria domingensis]